MLKEKNRPRLVFSFGEIPSYLKDESILTSYLELESNQERGTLEREIDQYMPNSQVSEYLFYARGKIKLKQRVG